MTVLAVHHDDVFFVYFSRTFWFLVPYGIGFKMMTISFGYLYSFLITADISNLFSINIVFVTAIIVNPTVVVFFLLLWSSEKFGVRVPYFFSWMCSVPHPLIPFFNLFYRFPSCITMHFAVSCFEDYLCVSTYNCMLTSIYIARQQEVGWYKCSNKIVLLHVGLS